MIVPYIVVRANNLPLTGLSDITRSEDIELAMCHITDMEQLLATHKHSFCDMLFALANSQTLQFRATIQLKRAVFNGKDIATIFENFEELLADLAHPWCDAARRLLTIKSSLAHTFLVNLEEARFNVKALSTSANFMHGIAFTRGQITPTVLRYLRNHHFDNKIALNDEETVYRYLTRALTKVSPFSSFSSVGFSQLQDNANTALTRSDAIAHRYSFDRSSLLKLFECFCIRYRQCWRYKLSENKMDEQNCVLSTLMDKSEVYPYRTYGLKTSLSLSKELHQSLSSHWLDWDALGLAIPKLITHDSVFQQWIRSGILSYSPRLDDGNFDLLGQFIRIAENVVLKAPSASNILCLLKTLAYKHEQLSAAVSQEQAQLIEEINACFDALMDLFDIRLAKTNGLVYHDSAIPQISPSNKSQIQSYADQAEEFLHTYLSANFKDGLQDSTLMYLRSKISDQAPSNIFSFCEQVHSAIAIEAARHADTVYDRAHPTEAQQLIMSLFAQIWDRRQDDEIVLESKPLPPSAKRRAFSVYGHQLDKNFVVNTIDSGYLRCFSRFFTFFDDTQVLDECKLAYGETLRNAHDFYDSFGYNTAHRPRLCEGRIWMEQQDDQADGDLSLNDLEVIWPSTQSYPSLRNKHTREAVNLRHTALFNTSHFPRLLETLTRISAMSEPCCFVFHAGLLKLVAESEPTAVIRFPRVKYRDLILSREQWWITQSTLPLRRGAESNFAYFLRLDHWRRACGLPQRVFVRRHDVSSGLAGGTGNLKKPLFIDFCSPIMTRMIGRCFNASFSHISFEEMLPDHQHRQVSGGESYFANEIIFERGIRTEKEVSDVQY
jgi:hypothetical protein